jgi:hypothetical protein
VSRARPAGPVRRADQDRRPTRRSRKDGGGGATYAREFATAVRDLFARVAALVTSIGVLVIVAGILLAVLRANPTDSIVLEVHRWARWLAGPFDGMFSFRSAEGAIALNWGIAAVVYLNVGVLIAGSRLVAATHDYRALARWTPRSGDL